MRVSDKLRIKQLIASASDSGAANPAQREHLRSTIWRLHQLLDEAMGGGTAHELAELLNNIAHNGDRIQSAIIAWVDLIEVLVHHTEVRYGEAPGRGALKKAEVKGVIDYILKADHFSLGIPNLPPALEPVTVDILSSWIIDAVVNVANSYGWWPPEAAPEPRGLDALLGLALARIGQFFNPVIDFVSRVFVRLWFILRPPERLSPAIRSALVRLEQEGLIVQQKDIVKEAVNVIVWVGSHSQQITASVELVFAVVQEVEGFLALDGSSKKAYAHDLVFAVLDDLGFTPPPGLISAIVSALVDVSIDAAVHLLNRHAVFTHHTAEVAARPTAAAPARRPIQPVPGTRVRARRAPPTPAPRRRP
jgi:hypothetical protein